MPEEPGVNVRPLRVLQVGTVETGGGAASVAGNLMRGYRARGCRGVDGGGTKDERRSRCLHAARMISRAVYRMTGYVALQRRLRGMAGRSSGSGWGWLSRSLRLATHPRAFVERAGGKEDFEFPATYSLLDLTPARPDIVHCHNLHGGYFDLRALRVAQPPRADRPDAPRCLAAQRTLRALVRLRAMDDGVWGVPGSHDLPRAIARRHGGQLDPQA